MKGLPGYPQSNRTEKGRLHPSSTSCMTLGNFPNHSEPQFPVLPGPPQQASRASLPHAWGTSMAVSASGLLG